MSEHLTEIELAEYLDYLRFGKEANPAVLSHLEVCFDCREVILDATALWPEALEKPQKQKADWKKYVWPVAAAIIPVIMITGLYFFLKTPLGEIPEIAEIKSPKPPVKQESQPTITEKQERVAAKRGTKPSATPNHLLAANFEPNPMFDQFVGSAIRSQSFEVFSPKTDENYTDKITFSWKGNPEGLTLILLDNRGNILKKTPVSGDQLAIDNLAAGLYYWKIENESEALMVGRFTVKK